MSRVQLDYLLLDVNFLHKPTVRALRYKFGWISVLWLIECYALMSRATNARIDDDAALAVAQDFGILNGTELIEHALRVDEDHKEGLMRREFGKLSNIRVATDQENVSVKREKWRDKKREQRGVSPWTTEGTGVGTTPICRNTELLNTEVLDINKNGNPPFSEIDAMTVELPIRCDTPEIRNALRGWVARCRRNRRPLDHITLDAQIAGLGGDPRRFLNALIFSTGLTKCLNLIEPPEVETREGDGNFHRKSKLDLELERFAKP